MGGLKLIVTERLMCCKCVLHTGCRDNDHLTSNATKAEVKGAGACQYDPSRIVLYIYFPIIFFNWTGSMASTLCPLCPTVVSAIHMAL